MSSAAKLVEQAKALAAASDSSTPVDLAGHLAVFSKRLDADGPDAEATVAHARSVVDMAAHLGVKAPAAKRPAPRGKG